MKKNFLLVLFIWLSAITISAQNFSPYKHGWKPDGYIGGTGISVVITSSLIDSKITPLTEMDVTNLSRTMVNRFDRSATYNYSVTSAKASDILVGLCALSPMLLNLNKNIRSDFKNFSLIYSQTLLFAVFLPKYAKGSVERIRPFVYNPDAPMEDKLKAEAKRSYFSGHTTLAFATSILTAKMFSDYFPDSQYKPYVWSGSVLVAATTGYLRYRAGKHYPTDILTGAIIGTSIGLLIPAIHRQRN